MSHPSLGLLFGVLAGLLLILAAFFAGSETALMSLNRYRLRHRANEGNRGARLAERLLAHPDRLIGLILLLSTIVNVAAPMLVGFIALRLGGEFLVAFGAGALTPLLTDFLRGGSQDLRRPASRTSGAAGRVYLHAAAIAVSIPSCGPPTCSPTAFCACSASRRIRPRTP